MSLTGTLTVYIEEGTGKKKVKRQLLNINDKLQESWHHKSLALQSEKPWTVRLMPCVDHISDGEKIPRLYEAIQNFAF